MARYVVNATVTGFTLGEIVEIDPILFAPQIEAGYLSPVDERGDRIIEVTEPGGHWSGWQAPEPTPTTWPVTSTQTTVSSPIIHVDEIIDFIETADADDVEAITVLLTEELDALDDDTGELDLDDDE